jgi:hypothetical protein
MGFMQVYVATVLASKPRLQAERTCGIKTKLNGKNNTVTHPGESRTSKYNHTNLFKHNFLV